MTPVNASSSVSKRQPRPVRLLTSPDYASDMSRVSLQHLLIAQCHIRATEEKSCKAAETPSPENHPVTLSGRLIGRRAQCFPHQKFISPPPPKPQPDEAPKCHPNCLSSGLYSLRNPDHLLITRCWNVNCDMSLRQTE